MLFIFNDCDNCPVHAAGHGDKDCGNKAGEISPSPGTFVPFKFHYICGFKHTSSTQYCKYPKFWKRFMRAL